MTLLKVFVALEKNSAVCRQIARQRCNRREEACLCDWQLRSAYQDKLSYSCCSDAATNGVEEAASQGLYKACAIRRSKQQEETFRLNKKILYLSSNQTLKQEDYV